jgi:hypothetical protein
MNYLTLLPDGSCAFTDFKTATIFVDFSRCEQPGQSSQLTNTFQVNLTRATFT